MRLIGYSRVSTGEQAASGLGLAAQERSIRAWCALYHHELAAFVTDAGCSGATLDRPALQGALAALQRNEADGLVVFKLDRLTRSVRDLDALVTGHFGRARNPAALVSVSEAIDTSTAVGRMILTILATVAQWERETIAERTSAAMQVLRARRKLVGSVPYGSTLAPDGETLVSNAEELATIERGQALRTGGASFSAVARALAEEGRRARNGKPFVAQQVKRFLAC